MRDPDVSPMIAEAAEWYVQKGARVQGPYSAAEVARFLLLGRVRASDRVSRDGELWEPVTQVPELVPEELLDLGSPDGWRRYLDARAVHDERGGAVPPGAVVRIDADRRDRDPDPDVGPGIRIERGDGPDALARVREEWRAEDVVRPAPPRAPVRGKLLPWSLLCLTLAALGVVLWLDRAALPPG